MRGEGGLARTAIEITRIGDAPPEKATRAKRAGGSACSISRASLPARRARRASPSTAPMCLKISAGHLADSWPGGNGYRHRQALGAARPAHGAGRGALRQLLTEADVFSQSYRPGALAARGFSPEALAGLRRASSACRSRVGEPDRGARRRGFDSIGAGV